MVNKGQFKTGHTAWNRTPGKIPSKKVCRYCNKLFYKPDNYNIQQWLGKKYCSNKCRGASIKKYDSQKDRVEAWRRRQGILKIGSPEANKKVSELTKLAMKRPEVQEKIRAKRSSLSLEHRIKLSDVHKGKMPKNMLYANSAYPNIKRGYYDINGTTIFFRSKWEANYALYLDFLTDHKKIKKWEYEPDTFIFEAIQFGTRSYTPDFKVFDFKDEFEYHEVKGYMDSKSKTKLKRMDKYYPNIKLKLVAGDEYNIIFRQLKGIINFY